MRGTAAGGRRTDEDGFLCWTAEYVCLVSVTKQTAAAGIDLAAGIRWLLGAKK